MKSENRDLVIDTCAHAVRHSHDEAETYKRPDEKTPYRPVKGGRQVIDTGSYGEDIGR